VTSASNPELLELLSKVWVIASLCVRWPVAQSHTGPDRQDPEGDGPVDDEGVGRGPG